MSESLTGRVDVRLTNNANNERTIHVSISGLPTWLLSMIRDSALESGGATYAGTVGEGPTSVQFYSKKVFVVSTPAPPPKE